MKYETHVQTTYYGDLIIISTTYLLLLIFSTSSTIFEKKYRLEIKTQRKSNQVYQNVYAC